MFLKYLLEYNLLDVNINQENNIQDVGYLVAGDDHGGGARVGPQAQSGPRAHTQHSRSDKLSVGRFS